MLLLSGVTSLFVRVIVQQIQKLSEPFKWFGDNIVDEKINHEGNPVLRWQSDNVEVVKDVNDNIRPSKKHSKDKIDGIAASINAIAEMMECKKEEVEDDPYAEGVTFV